MTGVRAHPEISTHRFRLPEWLRVAGMTGVLIAATLALWFMDDITPDSNMRRIGYGVALVAGAITLGMTLLWFDEQRQIRKWNQWVCPHCHKAYQLAQFSDVKFWNHKDTGKRAGVMLRCSLCNHETAFDTAGKAHSP